ncbi:proapoptotic nucleolar protein 1-like [Ammospiza caudacuta]|uniref:proapoptotic nucleolar protein 1-like n=1 Tax=Ammospiza caudacuta TaxID=2857398 RepID=UPI002739C2B8|nr:proapoptotic nucleolar protein 1-like [Ammospiza caudacuta]
MPGLSLRGAQGGAQTGARPPSAALGGGSSQTGDTLGGTPGARYPPRAAPARRGPAGMRGALLPSPGVRPHCAPPPRGGRLHGASPQHQVPSLLMFPELGRYNTIKVDNTSDVCYDIVVLRRRLQPRQRAPGGRAVPVPPVPPAGPSPAGISLQPGRGRRGRVPGAARVRGALPAGAVSAALAWANATI